jgi:hypothetical protein
MEPAESEACTRHTLAGQQLYFYGSNDEPDL